MLSWSIHDSWLGTLKWLTKKRQKSNIGADNAEAAVLKGYNVDQERNNCIHLMWFSEAVRRTSVHFCSFRPWHVMLWSHATLEHSQHTFYSTKITWESHAGKIFFIFKWSCEADLSFRNSKAKLWWHYWRYQGLLIQNRHPTFMCVKEILSLTDGVINSLPWDYEIILYFMSMFIEFQIKLKKKFVSVLGHNLEMAMLSSLFF